MGFFDNFKEKANNLAQVGVAQSKRLAEIAKLKTANLGEEDTIKKAYIELGKLYYAEKGCAPDGAYAAACEKITAAKAAIEVNNDRIAELKEEDEPTSEPEIVVVTPTAEVTVTEADFVEEEFVTEAEPAAGETHAEEENSQTEE